MGKLGGHSAKTLLAWGPVTLAVLIFCGSLVSAFGQAATVDTTWELGNRVWTPPRVGSFWAWSRGKHFPPVPALPPPMAQAQVAVYEILNRPGCYVYDDRDLAAAGYYEQEAAQTQSLSPLGLGITPDSPGPTPGGPLYLLTGPTSGNQVWINLTNTHSGVFYQLESVHGLASPGPNSWTFGPILQDTQGTNEISYGNFQADRYLQTYWRAVGGSTVVSISLHPDYNMAVEPGSNDNGTIGKFHITINPPISSGFTLVYQISGNAAGGVDYSNLPGTLTIPANAASADIPIYPLRDAPGGTDQSVILNLVLTNGYLVDPNHFTATLKIYEPRPSGMAVAILDSGWTKLNGLSATNWNYFVLPESVKEALRSDGTPWTVLSDLDIANGLLLTTNGTPKYPILIALACESIRDDEIAPLTNYVAAGGFILAGSSSFTRTTNAASRANFALAAQMGLSCSPSATNWYENTYLLKLTNHTLVNDLPDGSLVWRMPTFADEISWGSCLDNHNYNAPHPVWQATPTTATVLARGDYANPNPSSPYITANQYGSGYLIYDAAMSPLLGHGGFAPGMYAYVIMRRAIEWAFQSAGRPIVKVSPWPYPYNAAFTVRHDLENFSDEVVGVADSAYIEFTNGAKGDYYFCTGAITDQVNYASIVANLQQAVSSYGATIGPHNGGLPNPHLSSDTNSTCFAKTDDYIYFHWGPDEALDASFGYDYASNSMAISFNQIETWLPNQATNPRVWVAPYFNATREDCYRIQEGLNVKITGDQKLTPLPAFTLSTQTDGKRYPILSEPVSDWFVSGSVAQSLDPWHAPGIHTTQTMEDGVDFYYQMGFLINFYCHALATGYRPYGPSGAAGYLSPQYIQYGMNAQIHPRVWAANARDLYQWWLTRSTVQISAGSYSTNATHTVAAVAISGAHDTNTAIEILAIGSGSAVVSQLLTNGAVATTNIYRTVGEVIKVRVGTAITNVQAEYFPGPFARNDNYTMLQGQTLNVAAAAGVLSNDWSGTWSGLSAILTGGPYHGNLTLNLDGSFSYTPTNAFWGTECFTYEATDGQNNFGIATATISVTRTNSLFDDDFVRCTGNALTPWQVYSGTWSLGGGLMQGNRSGDYGYSYVTPVWTNYSVEAQVQLSDATYGGGIGARLTTGTGAHYAAWLYPSANIINLVKFSSWNTWGYNGSAYSPMAQTNVTVDTGWHPLKLVCSNAVLQVYYHGTNVITMQDADSAQPVYSTGAISLDLYDGAISVSNLVVAPIP
jgi:hypothetical protein